MARLVVHHLVPVTCPKQTAADSKPWQLVEATLYGRTVTVRFKPFTA